MDRPNQKRVTYSEYVTRPDGTRVEIHHFTTRKHPEPATPNPRAAEAIALFGSQRGENA